LKKRKIYTPGAAQIVRHDRQAFHRGKNSESQCEYVAVEEKLSNETLLEQIAFDPSEG
jgi:hypothetical protein